MELAVHLRDVKQADRLAGLAEDLAGFYDEELPPFNGWGRGAVASCSRVYVGDEFCSNRLPPLTELKALLEFASASEMDVTFLAPPLTDGGIEACSPLLDCLRASFPGAEVVFNDWGFLFFLKEHYPEFVPAAGRLLDKGFKDPRLEDVAALSSLSPEIEVLLNTSSFDNAGIRQKLIELGVARLERDLHPYRQSPPGDDPKLRTSIYFPFGYVTTGRVCWTSTFNEHVKSRFVPLSECPRPCETITLQLKSADASLPLVQSGNTVYYLYAPAALNAIFQAAERGRARLVYQGFAL